MTTPNAIAAIMGSFFPKTEKVISESLSTEQHASFTAEVTELNDRISAQATANGLVVADLATANTTIAQLNATISTLQASETGLNAQIASLTTERNLYKEQHEKAASQGNRDPNEDESSRQSSKVASYNAHALAEFQKAKA